MKFFAQADYLSPPTYSKYEDVVDGQKRNSLPEQNTFQKEAERFKRSLIEFENNDNHRIEHVQIFYETTSRQSDRELYAFSVFLVFTILCLTLNIWIKKVLTDSPTINPTAAPSWLSQIPSVSPTPSETSRPSSSHRPHFDKTPPPSDSSRPSLAPTRTPSIRPSMKPSNFVTNVNDFISGMVLLMQMLLNGIYEMDASYTYQSQPGVKDYEV